MVIGCFDYICANDPVGVSISCDANVAFFKAMFHCYVHYSGVALSRSRRFRAVAHCCVSN